MLRWGFFRHWGKREFTPATLPADYRSLMLLSLADLDFFITEKFSENPTLAASLRKGRNGMFQAASDFIGMESGDVFDSALFYEFVAKASAYDPFELTLNLAEIFRAESGEAGLFHLADLLDMPVANWKTVLEAAAFCREVEAETPPRRVATQAKFIMRHSQKILRNKTQAIADRIDWQQQLYFLFYCTASARGLFKPPPQKIDVREACRFSYQLGSQMGSKSMAALLAIRLWQTFTKPNADRGEEIGKIYRQALFDRSRKAFSLLSAPGSEAIMARPESAEQTVIFDRNSF